MHAEAEGLRCGAWPASLDPRGTRAAKPSASGSWSARCASSPSTVPGRQGGGHRRRAGHREGVDLPTLRFQGRSLLRGLQAGRAPRCPAWLDAPDAILEEGFFATVTYWLERTRAPRGRGLGPVSRRRSSVTSAPIFAEARHQPVHGQRGPLRHARLRGVRDPSGRGPRRRRTRHGRVHGGLARGTIQDALVTEELDPGLFHRQRTARAPKMRVEHFTNLLQSAIGAASPPPHPDP